MYIDDYSAVYALWLSCKGMGLNSVDDSKEGVARFLQRNPETCFVAEEEEKIIGVILAGSDGRRGYIYHTAAAPEMRRKGCGTALVNSALSALNRLGIIKTALVVFERNESGNLFWEKLGFSKREDLVYRNRQLTEMVRIDT